MSADSITATSPIFKLTKEGDRSRVRICAPQVRSHYDLREFTTSWPEGLLRALAELKGEWFCDSYQRFEHPNYVQKHFDVILDFYGINLKGCRILDFGCGYGVSSYCLIRRGATSIVATDLNEKSLDFARRFFPTMGYSSFVDIVQGQPIVHLEPNSFDMIWLEAVVEHLLPEERVNYFKEFWRALKPNGFLIVTETPNRWWPRETHTTGGRWLIPWMKPEKVFRVMRGDQRFKSYSDTEFYRSGIIGSTYAEIWDSLGCPGDCDSLALARKGYLKFFYSHARQRKVWKTLLVELINSLEPLALHLFRRPVTAFMPYLNHLAFFKRT